MKNMKKIIIRCLTVPSKGYGNFSRCINLAESLRKKNCHIFFVVDSNKSISDELKNRKFDYFLIPNSKSHYQKTTMFTKFLKNNLFDFCILDMREYGENLSKKLFQNNIKHVLFDDAWCKRVYANMIYNGTNVKKYHNYEIINKNSKLYLGPNYWILDKNFKTFAKKPSSIKPKKTFSIVISMGGSDPYNLTTSTTESILKIPNLHLSVIIGSFFSHKNLLKKLIKSNQKISLYESSNQIWKIFSNADLVICNGGNTLFELTCMGVPTMCIPMVKHEIKYAQEFSSKNCISNLNLREKNTSIIRSNVLKLLNNTKLRKTMCIHSKKTVDGKGLNRVLKKILEL